MPGATVALLGDLQQRNRMGKVATQSTDLHLHHYPHEGTQATVLVPDRHPERVQALSHAVLCSQAGVLCATRLDAPLGECVLAAHAAGLTHGSVVVGPDLHPDQVRPLLAGTTLEAWQVYGPDAWDAARDHAASAPVPAAEGPAQVLVDHVFPVTGVGTVVLGLVRQGTLRRNDTLYAWPGRTLCPVRSIQVHDEDRNEASTGDRVGVALRGTRGDAVARGMVLAPDDNDLTVVAAGQETQFHLERSRHARHALREGSVLHLGVGMQCVPVRLQAPPPGPGEAGPVTVVAEGDLVHAPGEHAVLWNVDAAPQRVVGAARLP